LSKGSISLDQVEARKKLAPAPRRLSGLQLKVLALFRDCLRAARRLPDAPSRAAARERVSREFRARARGVDRLDIQRVEFLMRQARKQLELLAMPGVTAFANSQAPAARLS